MPFVLFTFLCTPLHTADKLPPTLQERLEAKEKQAQDTGYTINLKDISILEYIHFVSKICDVNFIYNEADLNFPVSVVSKEPIVPSDIMSSLVQMLRVNGLMVSEQDNNLLIHKNPEVKQLATVVSKDDQIPTSIPIITRIFKIENIPVSSLASILRPMISVQAGLEISTSTRHIIITDIVENINKIEELIAILDAPESPVSISTYETKFHAPDKLIPLVHQLLAPSIEGNPFILVSQEPMDTIFIVSTPSLIKQAQTVLESLDTRPKKIDKNLSNENVFIYKTINRTPEVVAESLKNVVEGLKNSGFQENDLLETINDSQIIPSTSSILFTAPPATIVKLKEILASIDVPSSQEARQTFFMYTPITVPAPVLKRTLAQVAENLQNENEADPMLINSLENVRLIEKNNALMFTGNKDTFAKIQELLKTLDNPNAQKLGAVVNNFFLFHPALASKEQIESYVRNLATELDASGIDEQGLVEALNSMRWVPDSNSFIFHGNQDALDRIKQMLTTFDSQEEQKKATASSNYFLYKLQHVSGSTIEEDLDNFVKKLKTQKVQQPQLIAVLENIKWIKETNSILLTGYPQAIEDAKTIIAQFDVERKDQALDHSNFFIYKPKFMPASFIEKSLKEVKDNLEKAQLSDPNLINTINSMKFVESSGSLVFTGNDQSLQKLQSILTLIDSPEAGADEKSTVFVYKIQSAPVQILTSSIQSITEDLEKTRSADQFLINALKSMKYEKTTNSLIFTGVPSALNKIKPLLEKFDVSSGIVGEAPSNFFVYKPQYVEGEALENILRDFAQHLKVTGFANPNLFNTIDNMHYAPNTNSLIFSGDSKSIDEVKNLLATFDVHQQNGEPAEGGKGLITPIDQTSFLVYKLQYHRGDEIRSALKQIANDLIATKAPVQQNLLNAINTIQWIQVTNSLLCTGDQETMTRLKELIKNLDIPLKQVFIEMLVIETSFSNLLTFGLNWGNRFKFRDRFVANASNFNPNTNPATANTFGSNLNSISATTTPQGTDIPFESKFDLGVIGDIIMHKGKSFISLGSLLDALQNDGETSIVVTPKLICQDGKTSSVFIGRNIPYVGSTNSVTGASTSQTTNLEYRDIGLNLSLTPVLGNTDTVTLSIVMEKSQQATDAYGNTVSTTLNSNNTVVGITTSKTNMNTTVHIPNKSFLVLSGMVTDSKVRTKAGFPCLGGIPLIGAAFSNTQKTDTKDNLVIFIRPHILTSYKDMQHLTESQEDFFRENMGSAQLERDFEESIEQYKTLDVDEEDDTGEASPVYYDENEDDDDGTQFYPEDQIS